MKALADSILPQLPVAVYTTDENGLITYYNDQAVRLWGRSPRLNDPTELQFCGSWRLYSPDGTFLPHEKCPMALALKYGKSFRGEEIGIERPDGSRAAALVNINPVFTPDGRLSGAVNVLFEISDHKRAEENTWRLAALVESSNDAIVSKTLEGVITSWNRAAQKMFGYEEGEVTGKNIRIIIPESRQEEEDMIIEKIRKGEKVESFETIRVTRDGKPVPVSLTISPIKNAGGKIIGASKIARDISFLIEARRKLERYNLELKKLNRFKDNFIAMASHELKTPLAIMKANLQFLELQLDAEDKEWKELVAKSVEQANRLNDIETYFLDISKMQTGKFELSFTVFNMNDLLKECIRNARLLNDTHRIEHNCNVGRIDIFADRARIGQVINNLLSNAVKYSPEKDHVAVTCYLEEEHLIIRVTDFGPGITEDQLEKIFDIFFRGEEMRLYPGLGIGLYLSQQIIGAHQGKIWVESKVGEGSSFYVKLPLNHIKYN